jgi:hypothetical protein
MKLTKTKLKQIIKETIKEGLPGTGLTGSSRRVPTLPEPWTPESAEKQREAGFVGARAGELKESKEILLDNMKAARAAEEYGVASSLEQSIMALEEAISALFYARKERGSK